MTTVEFTYSDDLVSDFHKDARGYRPTEYFWEQWHQSPAELKQEIWNMLNEEMEICNAQEAEQEKQALNEFRDRLAQAMQAMGCDWKQAIRVMAEYAKEDVDCDQSFGYFLWDNGIGYQDRINIIKLFKEDQNNAN